MSLTQALQLSESLAQRHLAKGQEVTYGLLLLYLDVLQAKVGWGELLPHKPQKGRGGGGQPLGGYQFFSVFMGDLCLCVVVGDVVQTFRCGCRGCGV